MREPMYSDMATVLCERRMEGRKGRWRMQRVMGDDVVAGNSARGEEEAQLELAMSSFS